MWLSVIAYSQGHLSIYFWVYLAPLIQARQLGLGCRMTSETEHEGWVTKKQPQGRGSVISNYPGICVDI
jgi:hypothetical protein